MSSHNVDDRSRSGQISSHNHRPSTEDDFDSLHRFIIPSHPLFFAMTAPEAAPVAASELRRSFRRKARQWLAQSQQEQPLAAGALRVVSLRGLLASGWRGCDAGRQAAHALQHQGAFLLELSAREVVMLGEALGASATLFAPRHAGLTTPLHGGKAMVEYRAGDAAAGTAPALPTHVRRAAEVAHELLAAVGAATLRALCGTYDPHDVAFPLATPVMDLEALLGQSMPSTRGSGSGSARARAATATPAGDSVLTFLHYGSGAEAAAHTDRGLLTLVYAVEAGLQLRLRGAGGAWTVPPVQAHMLLVFAGECLQLATGNAVPATLHRVVPCGAARRSLVLRLRAHTQAPLPLTYGLYWRCANVAAFNARFAATHSSVNEPLCVPSAQAVAPVAPLTTGTGEQLPGSLAECVLATSDLAALLVAPLGDNAAALARAECVCRALRDAVAPHWRRLCLALVGRHGTELLPRCIPPNDARQWRTLHRCMTCDVNLIIRGPEHAAHFKLRRLTNMDQVFGAYCTKFQLARNSIRFLIDGQRLGRSATPYTLRLAEGDSIDAMMEQVGD